MTGRAERSLQALPADYDDSRIAIIPAGLCHPCKANGADALWRPECAPLWYPLPRNEPWLRHNAWFEAGVIPLVGRRVGRLPATDAPAA